MPESDGRLLNFVMRIKSARSLRNPALLAVQGVHPVRPLAQKRLAPPARLARLASGQNPWFLAILQRGFAGKRSIQPLSYWL
jgi:hypothetical protein